MKEEYIRAAQNYFGWLTNWSRISSPRIGIDIQADAVDIDFDKLDKDVEGKLLEPPPIPMASAFIEKVHELLKKAGADERVLFPKEPDITLEDAQAKVARFLPTQCAMML